MRFGSGVSISQETGGAVEEALGRALSGTSEAPDLVFCFATFHHGSDTALVAGHLSAATSMSGVSLGAISSGIVADSEEFESGAALVVWAAWLGDVEATPLRLRAFPTDQGIGIGGSDLPDTTKGVVLLADPFSFPAGQFAESLQPVPVVGGIPGSLANETLIFLNGQTYTNGAVAVGLSGSLMFQAVVSEGFLPVGSPATVTKASGRVVEQIAGISAVSFVEKLIEGLDEVTQKLVRSGLQIGVAIDEYATDRAAGDYHVTAVAGADRASGSILAGDEVSVGSTIQFHLRDARSADDDLNQAVAGFAGGSGMLLFTSNARGEAFFGQPHHDASLVGSACQSAALAGMIGAAEIGPMAGTSRIHSFSAVAVEISEPA